MGDKIRTKGTIFAHLIFLAHWQKVCHKWWKVEDVRWKVKGGRGEVERSD